jgi:hypothetical protein
MDQKQTLTRVAEKRAVRYAFVAVSTMPPEHFAATLLFVMGLSEKHRYKMRDYTYGILQQFADRRITKRTLPGAGILY